MKSTVNRTYFLLFLTVLSLETILPMYTTTARPIAAQLDNSTISGEGDSVRRPNGTLNGIYALLFFVALVSISMTLRKKKRKIRKVIALIILFVSIHPFVNSLPSQSFNTTNAGSVALAVFLVIVALLIAFVPRVYRRKKTIPWKKYNGIRRQFPIQVRDQVLKAQQNKCANCVLSILPPLVHYDHMDGNHSNIEISNCQALCPNCHSLKTDDDRRNQ